MYITYKTTNLITGEYYIGSHKTDNLEDNYLGSGRILRKSIEKFGAENHKREILGVFDTREESVELEHELIKQKKEDVHCINDSFGGGSYDYINANGLNNNGGNYIIAHKTHLERLKTDAEYKKRVGANITAGLLNSDKVKLVGLRKRGTVGTFTGREHTEETKAIMRESHKGKHKGSSNSQFGTYWITNGSDSMKWSDKKGDIPDGYYRGRGAKFLKNK